MRPSMRQAASRFAPRTRADGSQARSRRRIGALEALEGRLLLASDTLTVSSGGLLSFVGSSDANAVTIAQDTTAFTYTFTDTVDTITASSSNGSVTVSGSGTNTVVVTYATGALTAMSVDGGGGGDTITLEATDVPTTLTENGMAGVLPNTFVVSNTGGSDGIQGVTAAVSITDNTGLENVVVSDVSDPSARTSTLMADNVGDTSSIAGLAPGTISFQPSELNLLSIDGGSGLNTITVDNTPFRTITTIDAPDQATTLLGTKGSVIEEGGGSITIGGSGAATTTNILGSIAVEGNLGVLDVDVNDSGNTTASTVTQSFAPNGTEYAGSLTGLTPATIILQSNSVNLLTIQGGSGGNTYSIGQTNPAGEVIETGTGSNSVSVLASVGALDVVGSGGSDTVDLGATGSTGSLSGFVQAVSVANTTRSTTLNINDVADSTARTLTLSTAMNLNALNGFFANPITFGTTAVSVLNVTLGSGGDNLTLPFTPAPISNFVSDAADTFLVQGTTAADTLNIQGEGGADVVMVGNAGLVSSILGPINVTNTAALTLLTVDDSSDTSATPVNATVSDPSTGPTLTGFTPSPIGYASDGLTSLAILGGSNADHLTVDFATGNPVPGGSGLIFNSGQNSSGSATDELDLENGSFTTESYTPSGPGEGQIVLDSSKIAFFKLEPSGGAAALPITDSTTASTFTFSAPATAVATTLGNGPTIGGLASASISSGDSPTAFAAIDLLNKATVILDTTASTSGVNVTIDETVAATGLKTIGVTNGSTADTVGLDATPTGVNTSVSTENGNDDVGAIIPGLAASPYTNIVDGGNGTDALGLDADGGMATLIPPGDPSLPSGTPTGFGAVEEAGHTLEFGNFESITLKNTVAPTPVLATVPTFSVQSGSALSNALVGTFTSAGFGSASEFTATIDWGDGTPSTTGTIVADTSKPGTFDVMGSHTYTIPKGLETVTLTVTDNGGTNTTTIGGVPTTVITTPSASASLATTKVAVSLDPLTSTGTTITPESGSAFNGIVANFTDPNGPGSTYMASINWGDGTAPTSATAITLVTTSPTSVSYSVAGSHTYATSGSYPVTVSISSSNDQTTVANGTATVSAPALTTAGTTFQAVRGIAVTGVVAGFTDPSTLSPTYTETINWGDGTSSAATSLTKVATTPSGGSTYLVDGTHKYLSAGTFPISVSIVSSAGSTGTAKSTASVAPSQVTITTVPVSAGVGVPFTGVIGTFTDTAGAEPISSYSVFVVYNDGSNPVAGTLTPTTTANVFTITAPHEFAYAGTFNGYVAILAPGINATLGAVNSTVQGFTIIPTQLSSITAGVALSNVQVATIYGPSAANISESVPVEPPSGYQLTIDWGDGTSPSLGTLNPDGTVDGSHTYTFAGTFTITFTLGLPGIPQSDSVATESVTVTPAIVPLTGVLSPASDTGPSDTDGITKDNTPVFTGTAQPGTTVYLFAQASNAPGVTLSLGKTTVDASGTYSITSMIVPDNSYYVAVEEVSSSGTPVGLFTIFGSSTGPMIIDTIGPRITGVDFNHATGVVQVTYNDERAGIDPASVASAANYLFTPIPSGKKSLPITSLVPRSVVTNATQPDTIVATINSGVKLPYGKYLLTILSGGVEDLAGNALDGEFYGYFPSGNGSPGGEFQSRLTVKGAVVYNTNPLNKQQPVSLDSVKHVHAASISTGHATPTGPLHLAKAARR